MAVNLYTINNISTATVTYNGQAIAASTSYTPILSDQPKFASDPGLIADILANVVTITIGANVWSGAAAVEVLRTSADSSIQVSPLPATGSGFSFGSIATSATTSVAVLSTTYVLQSTNAQRSIASSSANDITAGTGARAVTITYLDQTGAGPFTETLTLNGTTGVNTTNTNICFIEKITVITAGSTGSNVGTISLYASTAKAGGVINTITATINQTLYAHHFVPSGKTCYISGFSFFNDSTNAGNGALMTLRASYPTVANSVSIQISDFNGFPGSPTSTTRSYTSPIQVIGPARVSAFVTPYAGGAQVQYASFDYIDN